MRVEAEGTGQRAKSRGRAQRAEGSWQKARLEGRGQWEEMARAEWVRERELA